MIDQLIELLGYSRSRGWLDAASFDSVDGPRSALRQAREDMSVVGAFGTWQQSPGNPRRKRFTPLLYLAQAADTEKAKETHRRVWSQGVAPLLLIITPAQIFVCEGFGFNGDRWLDQCVSIAAANAIVAAGNEIDDALRRVHASRLSSALAWRDFQLNPEQRVDQRLLSTLSALGGTLSAQSGATIEESNALIGRFLYFYILRDRGILDDHWLSQYDAVGIFDSRTDALTAEKVWRVFDALDDLLNGAIFPRAKKARKAFHNSDLRLLRDCIKLGDTLHGDGVQLSFLDFDLSSIQTETLSAIYEDFLKSEDSKSKRKDGVFYTPPFVVDYVLDRVEDQTPLKPEVRVIDCTAGSGVFIVGAYRRMVEFELQQTGRRVLSAERLRCILQDSIFGVEKSESAHSVACFSLYLTILDYVDPEDMARCLYGNASEKLFPPLDRQNVLCADLFSLRSPSETVKKWHIALGNPPWYDIAGVTPLHADVNKLHGNDVDSSEAAEFAFWWNVEHFVEPDGIVAMVMPSKSLMGPSASNFPRSLVANTELIGVTNLSHLRYQLFSDARQAACVLLTRKRLPSSRSRFWVYSPNRTNLLGPVKGAPWLISVDRSRVETVRQRDFSLVDEVGTRWFELLMLRSVDRHIKRYLVDTVSLRREALTLNDLLDTVGAELRKGGSPAQTGLPAELLFGADKHKPNDIRNRPGVLLVNDANSQQPLLVDGEDVLEAGPAAPDWLRSVAPAFRSRFSGNCLLVPRSMVQLAYASQPIAFNSSLHAIIFPEPDTGSADSRRQFLWALGLFLESTVAKYLFALFGRLWILDGTRLEKNDLLGLPAPFKAVDDPLVEQFLLAATDEQRTALVCERFQLNGILLGAVQEYVNFRSGYEDGGVPTQATLRPSSEDLERYRKALAFSLRSVDPNGTTAINVGRAAPALDALEVSVDFFNAEHQDMQPDYELSEGISLRVDKAGSRALFIKPAEKFRWTVEAGYSDGAMLIGELMDPNRAAD